MSSQYPFGELGETITQDTSINVVKKLNFSSSEEYDMIQHMVHFLKAAKHENLVNLEKVLTNEDQIQLYYEYAPFRLEKWVVDINEDLIESLQEQMLELADYLCRSSIKFSFDPDCLGLSENMTVKYFLNQFAVDLDNSKENLEEIKKDVLMYFKELISPNCLKVEEDPKNRTQSLSTNGSYSPNEAEKFTEKIPSRESAPGKLMKSTVLSNRVQNSKKKCL